MTEPLVTQVREILAGGRGVQAGDRQFVPLVLFDSGARFGIDAGGEWIALLAASTARRSCVSCARISSGSSRARTCPLTSRTWHNA